MADEMQVTLPEGVLRPIIQAQVVAALQGQGRLMEEMVAFVLKSNVRENYKDYPFLEWACRKQLQAAIEDAVRAYVASQADAIKAEVARQLKGAHKQIAASLVSDVVKTAGEKWRMAVTIKLGGE